MIRHTETAHGGGVEISISLRRWPEECDVQTGGSSLNYNNADVPAAPPWLQTAADIDVAHFDSSGPPEPQPHSGVRPGHPGLSPEPPTPEHPRHHGQPHHPAAVGPPPATVQPQPQPSLPLDESESASFAQPGYPSPQQFSGPPPPPNFSATTFPTEQAVGPENPVPQPLPPMAPPQYNPGPPPTVQGFPPAGYPPSGPAQPQQEYGRPAPGAYGPASLDEVALLRKARRAPASGWRRTVHKLSAGAINPGESPEDLVYKQLIDRVNQPVRGDYRIAVLSLKGGVGKTTTTVGLGSTFASLRGDRVIAVDANPDLGTLAQRIPQQTRSTVRDLLADEAIFRYSDVRAHTSQAPSRLEVLASERDPAVAEAFSETDYRGVMTVLQRYYNIIITDCGTGLSHSAMNGVLDMANALILVTSPAIDGARSAGATLDWLQAHGFGHLVNSAVVVLSSSRPGASTIDTDQLSAHFLTRCRAVQQIPFDDHLAEGAEVDLDLLGKATRRALVEMAATVADDFPSTTTRRNAPYFND